MANTSKRRRGPLIFACCFVIALGLAIGLGVGLTHRGGGKDGADEPWESRSGSGSYRFATVASDNDICSAIGTRVLAEHGGSAADAGVAVMVCLGAVNAQHTGVGGGFLGIVYDTRKGQQNRTVSAIVARETATLSATRDMFNDDPDARQTGPRSPMVPGEVNGYGALHRQYGRAPWAALFQPTIDMCRTGWKVSESMALSINKALQGIRDSPELSSQFLKHDGSPFKEGDTMFNPKLAATLERIRDGGSNMFYTGELGQDIISDMQDAGVTWTMGDLAANEALWWHPVTADLHSINATLYTVPPPSSGAITALILKVMDEFNMKPEDLNNLEDKTKVYHRLAESFKFGLSKRKYFIGDKKFYTSGDPKLKWLDEITSDAYAKHIMSLIDDTKTQDAATYDLAPNDPIGGTTHINVLAADGSAFSYTATVGSLFGCKIRGARTGIIFNNGYSLFDVPTATNYTANLIEPGKRGRSSVSPILVRGGAGSTLSDVIWMAGTSGGPRIITATALVSTMALWLGQNVSYAVDLPRVHAQDATTLYYDPGMDDVVAGLRARGHSVQTAAPKFPYLGVTQAVDARTCPPCGGAAVCQTPCIHAACDWRKGGIPDGY